MKRKHILCLYFCVIHLSVWAQHNVLKQIIQADSFHIKYAQVLQNPAKYHLQVMYTQINRDSNNHPHLRRYLLCPETKDYFYPASLVKLPLVAMALEKIDNLKIKGLTKDTRLAVDSVYECEKRQYRDTTAENCYPSIAHYIKKMLLVSDNYSYNRIYEFLTPAYINKRLRELGYKRAMINQRFGGGCDTNDNRVTNSFTFLSDDSSVVIYKQAKDSNAASIINCAKKTIVGKGFMQDGKIMPPRDFIRSNYIPFEDENNILLSIIFPKCFESGKRFHLTHEDYQFLYKYMSMLPHESDYPHYDQKDYKDNFKKYVYFKPTDTIITDTSVRSFNIVGRAYGFISDCAYIVDVQHHTEFCLSVLIYANKRDILNISGYQYDELALPFMSDLGRLIYNYELKRKKKYPPELKSFEFHYP
jgi:hypothetical protein